MPVYEQTKLTLFQEDFPASLFPWLESKKVRTTTVICGRKCSELSESLRRIGSSVRMYLESCELREKTLSRIWSVKAMTSSCLLLKLRLSARGTGESESPLWATPNAMDGLPPRSPEGIQKIANGARKGRTRPSNLREQVDEETMLFWSTPTMRDYKGSNSMEHLKQEGNHHQKQLANQVKLWPTPKASDAIMGQTARTKGRPIEKSTHLQTRVYCVENGLLPTPRAQSATGPSQAPRRQGSPDLQTVIFWTTPSTGAGICGGTGNFEQLKKLQQNGQINEEERRQFSQGNGGQLNPDWVEWLMGFPIGWTSLPEFQE